MAANQHGEYMVTTEASMQCTPWRESRIELFLYYLASRLLQSTLALRRGDQRRRPQSVQVSIERRWRRNGEATLGPLACRLLAVRPEGANHQWRRVPPR